VRREEETAGGREERGRECEERGGDRKR